METIKSFTSLEQSKKLAEILPLESADMYYCKEGGLPHWKPVYETDYFTLRDTDFPSWSLSALLDVLPNPSLHKTYTGWRCDTYNENCTQFQLGDTADNQLDACVAMIEKLHKLNLL